MEPRDVLTLPIYKATLDITNQVIKYTENFKKHLQDTLGYKLIETSLDLLFLIVEANRFRGQKRVTCLEKYLIKLDYFKVLIKVAVENKLFSIKAMSHIFPILENLEKQAKGWRNKTAQSN